MPKYYVANNGDDARTGAVAQSQSTPWKTVSRVNGYGSFSSGDKVLFRCGDTWEEQLTVPIAGLIIGAYDDESGEIKESGLYRHIPANPPCLDGSSDITGTWVPAPFGEFYDDFEAGMATSWNNIVGTVGTYTTFGITAPTYGLGKCLQIASTVMPFKNITPSNEVFVLLDYMIGANDTIRSYVLSLGVAESLVLELMFNTNSGAGTAPLRLYNRVTLAQIGIGTTQFTVGTFVKIRLQCKISSGAVKVFVNDTLEMEYLGLNLGADHISRVGIGTASASQTVYVDNIAIDTTSDLTTSVLYKKAQTTAVNSTSGTMVWEDGEGYGAMASSAMATRSVPGTFWIGDGVLFCHTRDNLSPSTHDMRIAERNYCVVVGNTKDSTTVQHIEMKKSQNSCVVMSGTAANPLEDFTLKSCYIHDSNYSGVAITAAIDGAVVEGNLITDCHHAGTYANLLDSGVGPDNITIRRNYYARNGRQNVAIEELGSGKIHHNIFEDALYDGQKGISVEVVNAEGALTIFCNVFANSERELLYIQNFNGTVEIFNNYFDNDGTNVLVTTGASTSNLSMHDNIYIPRDSSSVSYAGTVYAISDFDDYQSVSSQDTDSVVSGVAFGNEYRITTTTIGSTSGHSHAETKDFDGNAIPYCGVSGNYSVGPHEPYSPPKDGFGPWVPFDGAFDLPVPLSSNAIGSVPRVVAIPGSPPAALIKRMVEFG